jgi:hypothetical protein
MNEDSRSFSPNEFSISDLHAAQAISELIMETLRAWNESAAMVQRTCSPDEFVTYRRAVGSLLGDLYFMARSLYSQHPDLEPAALSNDEELE